LERGGRFGRRRFPDVDFVVLRAKPERAFVLEAEGCSYGKRNTDNEMPVFEYGWHRAPSSD
jgi:hypothetical protein